MIPYTILAIVVLFLLINAAPGSIPVQILVLILISLLLKISEEVLHIYANSIIKDYFNKNKDKDDKDN